ncbi:MAG: transposase [Planctomycetes bacterium]|jgi:putative transposase|nr:transposase [Planctomycetota bacterium]
MPRRKRIALGGYVYHVLNRANGRLRIFRKDNDFLAFERILADGVQRFGMRLCGYCLMNNHWHLLLWPREDGDLSAFLRWVTQTHAQRYHTAHGTVGIGHVYQGRYKSFPVQDDRHYLTVLRYIESNPLRAGLVPRAPQWPWSSFSVRRGRECALPLAEGPVELPDNWTRLVHQHLEPEDVEVIDRSVRRGVPLGEASWILTTAERLQLTSTLRPKGRPRKCTGPL